jgi:2-methylisocitrate lyase-like PEP mutase family enzyme
MPRQSVQNTVAASFKKLHKPGDPVVVVNVWDASSAETAASVPGVKALATASYAVAATYGVKDNDLTYEQNMDAVARIIPVAQRHNLPLTVDFQDGYLDDIAKPVTELIKLGVFGANIEDLNDRTGKLRSKEESVQRIKAAAAAAKDAGVPDFVINARTDVIGEGGTVDEAIDRGKAFLDAGAVTVFVWGGSHGLRDAEVQKITKALNGRLSVVLPASAADGYLTVSEVKKIGVARVSIGPRLQFVAAKAMQKGIEELLST